MGAIAKLSTFVVLLAGAAGAYGLLNRVDIGLLSSATPEAPMASAGLSTEAEIDEELDYLGAQRTSSVAGWRNFLATHPRGRRAERAEAELRKFAPDEQTTAPLAGLTPAAAVSDAQSASSHGIVASAAPAPTTVEDACKGDEDRLAELRAKPSPEEVLRFAKDLRCAALVPEVEALIAGSAVADAERTSSSLEAKRVEEKTVSASPPAVALSSTDEVCKQEEGRLERLETSPSSEAVADFLKASRCESLRPQIQALMDDLNGPSKAQTAVAAPPADMICREDGERLARLRANPSPQEASRFATELRCEALLPQVMALTAGRAVGGAEPDNEASPAKAAIEDTRLASPATEEAASRPDDDCKREEDRLAQLGANPSGEAITDFLRASRCARLWPRVLALFEGSRSSSNAPASTGDSNDAIPAPTATNEPDQPVAPAKTETAPTAHVDAATAATNVASQQAIPAAEDGRVATADEGCLLDEQRLERLRGNPSRDEIARFARELRCEKLRPQLSRMADSLTDPTARALASVAPAGDRVLGEGSTAASACTSEQDMLNRVRMQPSPGAVQELWRNLRCERLRPQVRLVLESLDLTADPSADCRHEAEELKRIRSNPDRREAEDFARGVRCDVLKLQAARLLESLSE
jgi:hypothetical protein